MSKFKALDKYGGGILFNDTINLKNRFFNDYPVEYSRYYRKTNFFRLLYLQISKPSLRNQNYNENVQTRIRPPHHPTERANYYTFRRPLLGKGLLLLEMAKALRLFLESDRSP